MIAAAAVLVSCTSGGGGTSAAPTASPVAGQIAFDRMSGATDYEGSYISTVITHADGTGQQRLPIPEGWFGPVSPVWSSDGSKLVVSVRGESPGYGLPGPGRAAIVAPDGSGFRVLTPGKLDADMACSTWSPDGSKLLCSVDSNHDALEGIYAIGVDGTGLTRFDS